MASGFVASNGQDLDDLFMLYTSGTKAPATGFVVGTQDLADRYQAIGDGTAISNTGFVDGTEDLAQIFRDKNEALEAVTVSGQTINHFTVSPAAATAGIRVNADGTIDSRRGSTFTQIDASTDWIIPNSAASSEYEVRITNFFGDSLTFQDAAEDDWISLEFNRQWYLQAVSATRNCNFTLEIRKNGGAVLDSATYFLTADSSL